MRRAMRTRPWSCRTTTTPCARRSKGSSHRRATDSGVTAVASSRPDLEVWKFGGASLAYAGAIRKAAALIAGHTGPLVVVASALAGVTDQLMQGAVSAAAGQPGAATRVA